MRFVLVVAAFFPIVHAGSSRIAASGAITGRFLMANLLWTIIVVLFILWLLGFVMSFGGPLIHLVLVIAVILLIYNLLTRGRATL